MSNKKPFILIADDEESYGNIFKIKLTAEGYDTAVVANGEWVLQVLKRQIPDLILLDLMMPKMDGFTVLERLAENPKYRDIPVIVLSNLDRKKDNEMLNRDNVKAY